jgi:hypothetical protein
MDRVYRLLREAGEHDSVAQRNLQEARQILEDARDFMTRSDAHSSTERGAATEGPRRVASEMGLQFATVAVEWIALASLLLGGFALWGSALMPSAGASAWPTVLMSVLAAALAVLAARVLALLWQGYFDRSRLARHADALIHEIDRKLAEQVNERGSTA